MHPTEQQVVDVMVEKGVKPFFQMFSDYFRETSAYTLGPGDEYPDGMDQGEFFEAVSAVLLYGVLRMAEEHGKDFDLLVDDARRFAKPRVTIH